MERTPLDAVGFEATKSPWLQVAEKRPKHHGTIWIHVGNPWEIDPSYHVHNHPKQPWNIIIQAYVVLEMILKSVGSHEISYFKTYPAPESPPTRP